MSMKFPITKTLCKMNIHSVIEMGTYEAITDARGNMNSPYNTKRFKTYLIIITINVAI